ncbi:MAG: hypothetical protein ABI634_09550 [Acidobacteriota bacterium]
MRIRLLWTVALAGFLVAPLQAELKYTMRIHARPSTVAATMPSNPLVAMIAGVVAGTLAPEGGLELNITTGDKGTRVDYPKAYTIVPAGGATLLRADGSMIVLDPVKRTYWKMAKPDLSVLGGVAPTVTITRTGGSDTVAGVRADRATFEIRMPLPVPPGTQLPEGIPSEIRMSGEAWVAPQYKQYSKLAAGLLGGINAFGADTLAAEGLMMRSILRGELLGNQEVESVITAIAEAPAPASLFEIPAGYTEVPPPSGLPGPMPR